ncbi:hypothetical protein ACFQZI_14895 [Mucilaginibacter lutimaris]|uniref:Prepilin-type N-terminal cleavage/methylation domain-containing protein n=1 Tax=Mucilaginibacter lutimaris TaxID=931629 RepID=A0ABW2ZJ49_9SPHI
MAEMIKVSRLKADSLLEVIVAAVLVVIIFGIAMMVQANVMRASRPVKKVRAAACLRAAASRIERQQDTLQVDPGMTDLSVRCSMSPAGVGAARLKLIALGPRNDTLAMVDKIILWHE